MVTGGTRWDVIGHTGYLVGCDWSQGVHDMKGLGTTALHVEADRKACSQSLLVQASQPELHTDTHLGLTSPRKPESAISLAVKQTI